MPGTCPGHALIMPKQSLEYLKIDPKSTYGDDFPGIILSWVL